MSATGQVSPPTPLPPTESARLAALARYDVLGTTPEAAFDRITNLTSLTFGAPIAFVSLIGKDKQYFKSCFGLTLRETDRKYALCTQTILGNSVVVVHDARNDPHLAAHPFVVGAPHIRFYAGAPLRSVDGVNLGTLCVLDTKPRFDFTPAQEGLLAELAALVDDLLENRRLTRVVSEERAFLQAVLENVTDSIIACNAEGELTTFNEASRALHGLHEVALEPNEWAGYYDLYAADGVTPLALEEIPLYRAYRGETVKDSEMVVVPKGGAPHQLRVSGRSFSDPMGKLLGAVVAMHDVTEQRAAAATLRESEAHHRSIISNLTEGVVQQEADGRISTCNRAAEHILGLERSQMVGRDSLDPRWRSVHEDGSPYPGEEHPAMVALRTGNAQRDCVMGVHKPDGTLSWIMISAQPLLHAGSAEPYAVVSSFTDITELKRTEAQLRFDALHDVLTGLPTRRLLISHLEQAAARAKRHPDLYYALLFIDLDGFKTVNDTFGHRTGDELLIKVTERLRGCVREGDTVARFGGDEFVILVEGLLRPPDALPLAERILERLSFSVAGEGGEVAVSASIGVALPEVGIAASALLEQADAAMYRAKVAGKARIVVTGASSFG